MKNRNRIWQPETAAYKRFQFPVHGHQSVQRSSESSKVEQEVSAIKESSDQADSLVVSKSHPQDHEVAAQLQAEQYAAELQQVEKQSYQQGYEEGRRLAFEEAASKVAQQTQQVSEQHKLFLDNLHKELASLQTQHLQDRDRLSVWLGQVVEEVCRQVVRREVSTRQGQIVEIIRQTLDLIPESSGYAIHVCEQDADLLREMKPDFGIPWQLVVSHELVPGDCRIVASDGEADARLEGRLMQCLEIIRESLPATLEAIPS